MSAPRHILARTAHAGGLLVAMLAAGLVAPSTPAKAQQSLIGGGPAPQAPESGAPMLLQADEMIYDNQNNVVRAKGSVEIYYGNYTILADEVIYDQSVDTLTAEGNVRIKEPSGALINADRITLTDDFRDGFLRSLQIVTQEDARISAARAIREQGNTTVFERGVYTPCKPCEDNPEKPPTWRIKAKRIIHKKDQATIAYEDAKLEFLGVPVAYIPYFRHADPSVKRKSGFLIPQFGGSEELGFVTEIPYYFALAPNYDFTFSPKYASKRGVVWQGQWRQRFSNGKYSISFAGIDQTDAKDLQPGDKDFRGSIKTDGAFNINRYWQWGWDITAETDDTFRRFYDLDNILSTDRVSQVHLTGLRDRNYFDARIYNFGALTFEDTTLAESQVHPVIDYNYIFGQPVLGGELSFNTNVTSLTRDSGTDSHRIIGEVNWRRTLISDNGQVLTPFVGVRGDAYQVSNFVDPITGMLDDTDGKLRGMALAGAEYRYPFVKHTANASHVIEPIAQVIARPGSDQDEVPNEDARSLVFDDTLLLDIDKFSGYDRIETGTRANVAMRYTWQRNEGGYVRAVVGQSFHLTGDNEFSTDTGLEGTRSDYVTGLYVQPNPYLTFISQARFDDDDLELQRVDLSSAVITGPITASVIYANQKAQPALGVLTDREEVSGYASVLLTEHWSLIGALRYDVFGEQRVTDSLAVRYADDCFALTVTYSESFIRDRDIEPSSSVLVRFELKHLGAYDIDAGGLADAVIDPES